MSKTVDIKALKSEHNIRAVVQIGDFVFRQPARVVYLRLQDELGDESTPDSDASMTFARSCLIHPKTTTGDVDWPAFMEVLEDAPGALDLVTKELIDVAKGGAELSVKKL